MAMNKETKEMTRRAALKLFGAGTGALAISRFSAVAAFAEQQAQPAGPPRLTTFTGPGANPYWNSVGQIGRAHV